MAKRFNIAIIGDAQVGKSAFIERLINGTFRKEYTPTEGIDVYPLTFYTNKGDVIFNVFDCSAASDPQSIASLEGVIILFDVTNPNSYQNVPRWIQLARQAAPHTQIVLCGNKVEIKLRKIMARHITAHRNYGLAAYYDISARSCYAIERPFLCLAKAFLGVDTVFTSYDDDAASDADDIMEFAFDQQYISSNPPTPLLL